MLSSIADRIWDDNNDWPPEVSFLMSVLEGHCPFGAGPRAMPRVKYRVRAAVELDDAGSGDRLTLYTRDANTEGLGFISNHPLPVGAEARVLLPSPGDRAWVINCVVLRCEQIIHGWYEGAVRFKQPQHHFQVELAA